MATRNAFRVAFSLFLLGIVTFVLGVFIPTYSTNPSTGNFFIDVLGATFAQEDFVHKKQSIVGLIGYLLDAREWVLLTVVSLCAVGFPVAKFLVLAWMLLKKESPRYTNFLLKYGYFSMIEVFVVAIIVAGNIPIMNIRPEAGILPFTASVVLTFFCKRSIEKELPKNRNTTQNMERSHE